MIKIIKKLGGKEYLILLVISILVFVQVYFELLIPEYMSNITKLVQTPGAQTSKIWLYGGYMLMAACVSLGITFMTTYAVSYFSSLISYKVRSIFFNRIQDIAQEDIDNFSVASLITRATNDITQIEMFTGFGTMVFIRSPITAGYAIFKIMGKGVEWSIATAVVIGIMILVMGVVIVIMLPKLKELQSLIDKLNEVSRENLTGIRVVRAFNSEEYQQKKVFKVNEKLTEVQKFTQKIFAMIHPFMMMIMYFLNFIIYFIGAILISETILPKKVEIFGNMIVFSSYSSQIVVAFLMLALLLVMYSRAQVSAARVNEVLDTNSSVEEGNIIADNKSEKLEFKNVSFKYPDAEEYTIKDISFSAKKGETVAIIGQTGSGKSTIANLLTRLYDPTSGQILIDNVNIKEFTTHSLYNKLGYVPQRAMLFNMSVKDNIKFGENYKDIEDDDVKKAIELAQAKEFVENMEGGYEHTLSRGGTNVSGGQKQRLSIARAIARKPSILIFDDTFSALDFKTESVLRKSLEDIRRQSITILISSRVGSVLSADKIILLNNGEIEAIGTHKELWNNNDLYRENALSQLSEEELDARAK